MWNHHISKKFNTYIMSAFLNKALVQGKVKMTSPSTPPTHLPWNQIEISTHCVAGETWGRAVISWTTAWLVNWTSIWLLTLSIRWSGLVLITSTMKWTFIMQRTRNFALLYHLHLTWGILYNLILDMLYDSTNDPSYVQKFPEY